MPEITFTVNAKNIGILYMSTRDGSIDDMQVYIDGVLVTTLSGTVEGPDHHISTEVYTSKTAATHTVTLRRSPNSRGHHFELEGLLLS